MLGPFATTSRRYIAIHQVSLVAPPAIAIAQVACDVHDDNDDNDNA